MSDFWKDYEPEPTRPAPVQQPFGYFKAEPFGWTDCAETDEGAVALYEHPAAQPVQDKVTLIQTNVGIGEQAMEAYEAAKERDRADRSAPVQEPVAWMYEDMMGLVGVRVQKEKPIVARPVTPLYTTPPGGRQSEDCLTAAQRQSARSAWVGLTDEEVMNATRKEGHELLDFIYEYGTGSEGTEERVVAICKAIEAKLKEKNT
jgi:hypothetical protein